MTLIRITPPAVRPLSLAEAKAQLRIDFDVDDAQIEACIDAAVEHIDGDMGWLNRALCPQTWELRLDRFPGGWLAGRPDAGAHIEIPLPPLIEVVSVTYEDENGDTQTVDPDTYRVFDHGRRKSTIAPVRTATWPTPEPLHDGVRIRFKAGFASDDDPDVADVPAPIVSALKLMVTDLYQQRETFVTGTIAQPAPMSTTVERLLYPWRVGGLL